MKKHQEFSRVNVSTVPTDLLEAVRRAYENAYAPYSRFRVGAALRADDGTLYPGANVENSSYGLSRCAEQSAVQALISAGHRNFTQAVVLTATQQPSSPCGACRQVLFEFSPEAELFLVSTSGEAIRTTVRDLLPAGFRLRAERSG